MAKNLSPHQQDAPFVLAFNAECAMLANIGGKGINLSRLTRAGFPVPPGFVVTTAAYDAFVHEHNLNEQIFRLLQDIDTKTPESGEAISSQIRQFFHRPMFETVETAIKEMYREQFGNHPPALAVRSSATAEDLPDASFAGQQDTYLNIQGADALLEAIKHCWSSLWTARAIAYRTKTKMESETVSLAVVVQQLVFAEAAGVMFTANPVNGVRNELVINASWGLGEAIVSGLVVPDNIIFDKTTKKVISVMVADKTTMTVRTSDGTAEESVPAKKRHARVLDDAQITTLAELGKRVEAYYGSPQDIEWCYADGRFTIVQARAISVLPPEPLTWSSPSPDIWIHGGGSLEVLIEPVSPLGATYSVDAFRRAILRFMEQFGLKRIIPASFIEVVNGYLYICPAFNFPNPLEMGGIWRNFQTHFRSMSHFETEVAAYHDAVAALSCDEPTALSCVQIFHQLIGLIDAGMRYWLYITELAQAIPRQENRFIRYYQLFVRRHDDPEPQVLLRGQSDLPPLQAERSVYALSELAQDLGLQEILFQDNDPVPMLQQSETGRQWLNSLSEHLRHFGHQLFSLDPYMPTLADDPKPILLSIKTYLEGKEPPTLREERLATQRDQALHTIEARLTSKGAFTRFRTLLAAATDAAGMREKALFEVGLAWIPIRRNFLEIGRRFVAAKILKREEDIFWLTWEEMQQCASTLEMGKPTSSFIQTVFDRENLHKQQQKTTPPPLLPLGSKAKFWWKWIFPMPELTKQSSAQKIVGMGVSPGRVTSVARVITSPDEMSRLSQGEILVTRTTTPAWTPLFSNAAALVTDLGGPLAHGSIVAREYGIPAVMGTGIATQRIRDGQTITVDGVTGQVLLE